MTEVKVLITTIIPVMDISYLDETLQLLDAQTYEHIEVILCFPYRLANEVNRYEEQGNGLSKKVILCEGKEDPISFFVKGMAYAQGSVVVYHEADGKSYPTRMALQKSYLDEHVDKDGVGCLISVFQEHATSSDRFQDIEKRYNTYKTSKQIDNVTAYDHLAIYLPSLMIRKQLYDELLGEIDIKDEIHLTIKLLEKVAIDKIDQQLYGYRYDEKKDQWKEEGYRKCVKKYLTEDTKIHIKYKEYLKEIQNLVNTTKQGIEPPPVYKEVLIVVDALNIGGTETYVLNVVRSLRNEGIGCCILSNGGCMQQAFEMQNIPCYNLPIEKHYDSIVTEVEPILRKHKIIATISHSDKSHQLARQIKENYGIPYIVTLHGLFHAKETLYMVIPQAKNVICVSHPVKNYVAHYVEDKWLSKCKVIYNSIAPQLEQHGDKSESIKKHYNLSEDAKVVTYCSRLDYTKGMVCQEVLTCFGRVAAQYKKSYMLVVGDGRLKPHLQWVGEAINQSLGYEAIRFVGMHYDTMRYYRESYFVIGTGRVALEAMSCGTPVIAMGSKGVCDIVAPRTARLIKRTYFGDHEPYPELKKVSLEEAMTKLLENQSTRDKLGKWSKKWCQKVYGNKKNIAKLIKLLPKQ